jgi:hypothetical protein
MRYKKKPLSKVSERGKLRKHIGELHLQILRIKRGNKCEICGLQGMVGRFHILEVSTHPRLEFVEDNILLSHWMQNCQAHYLWHHFGSHDARNIRTANRIVALRGQDWESRLRARERFTSKIDMLYLLAKLHEFKQELKKLCG